MSKIALTFEKLDAMITAHVAPGSQAEAWKKACLEVFDAANAQLAACAAGPWCFDVENAPKDGSEVLLYWHAPLAQLAHT